MRLKGMEYCIFYYQLSGTHLMCAAGESTKPPSGNVTWVTTADKIEMGV